MSARRVLGGAQPLKDCCDLEKPAERSREALSAAEERLSKS